MTLDLEMLAVQRAEEQMESEAWRTEQKRDLSSPRGVKRCVSCGKPMYASGKTPGPDCTACQKAARRKTCLACDGANEVRGYCRRHWAHLLDSGVVDPLHVSFREGTGAPAGRMP